MPPTTPTGPASDVLDLSQAAEVREADGTRRYGSVDTLRRRIRAGLLPHDRVGTKYVVRVEDLEEMRDKASVAAHERSLEALREMAARSAALAPPISRERRELILRILSGKEI